MAKRPEKQTDLKIGQWVVLKILRNSFSARPIKHVSEKQIRVLDVDWRTGEPNAYGRYSIVRFEAVIGVFDDADEARTQAEKITSLTKEFEVNTIAPLTDQLLKARRDHEERIRSMF